MYSSRNLIKANEINANRLVTEFIIDENENVQL